MFSLASKIKQFFLFSKILYETYAYSIALSAQEINIGATFKKKGEIFSTEF